MVQISRDESHSESVVSVTVPDPSKLVYITSIWVSMKILPLSTVHVHRVKYENMSALDIYQTSFVIPPELLLILLVNCADIVTH